MDPQFIFGGRILYKLGETKNQRVLIGGKGIGYKFKFELSNVSDNLRMIALA